MDPSRGATFYMKETLKTGIVMSLLSVQGEMQSRIGLLQSFTRLFRILTYGIFVPIPM